MNRSAPRCGRKTLHQNPPSNAPVETLRALLTVHGPAIFGHGGNSTRVIKRLLALPAPLLDTPLQQLTAVQIQGLQNPSGPAATAPLPPAGLQVLMLGLHRAYRLGLVASTPDWLAPFTARLESNRYRRFIVCFLRMLDAREAALRHWRDKQNAALLAAGESPRPDLHTQAYVDEVKPLLLLLLHSDVQWSDWPALEWADIDLERGVVRLRSHHGERILQLRDTAKHVLQKWYLQCPASRQVFPPRARQTPEQHVEAILRVAKTIARSARHGS